MVSREDNLHFQRGVSESYWTLIWFHSHFLPSRIIQLWVILNSGHLQHQEIYPFSILICQLMVILLSPSKVWSKWSGGDRKQRNLLLQLGKIKIPNWRISKFYVHATNHPKRSPYLLHYVSDTDSEVCTFTILPNILRAAIPVRHEASVWEILSCEPILLYLH